ncbi:MAG: SpoIVB peptidase [Lachnospiraceae bacterium]|nr:SpoIVB peptidase [Lachnospiraceae bacterium]
MKRKISVDGQWKRWILYWGIILSAVVIIGAVLYTWWLQIPGTIRIKAGVEETFDFHVPASGEVYLEAVQVSEFGSAIQSDTLKVDLSEKLTLKSEKLTTYQMNVKLFGVMPLKQVNIQVIEDRMVMPAGVPIGIYVETEGVLVVGVGEFDGMDGLVYAPSKYIIRNGDYILKVNGETVEGKKQFMDLVEEYGDEEITLTVKREDEQVELKVTPAKNQNGENKLGIWVRDNAQGIGTLTFVDECGNFGALGHGINDVDTSQLMKLEEGLLYETNIIAIKKGAKGEPGELTGMISYSDKNIVGSIEDNTEAGIYGECNVGKMPLMEEAHMYPIGLKQEIHLGEAQIVSTVGTEREYYDIEITEVRLDHDNVNRGIVIEVTDSKLLNLTGGIVQGMSGSPILQNGRIVGAVTHVLVNDPTRGYGIFIENMLEH